MTVSYRRSVEVVACPEVLVCGAGCAGIGAAIAAARMGATTVAVEQWPFAGGNITAANVPGTCGLADMSTGELAVGGVALELLDRTGVLKLPLKSTRLFEPIMDERKLSKAFLKLPYLWEPEKVKIEADKLLKESRVAVLYHTKIADVVTSGSSVDYVILANKAGVTAVKPKVVIDCTGDGDVAAWAGVPYDMDEAPQAMTIEFHIGNVRVPEDKQEIQNRCAAVLQEARKKGRMGIYGGPWLGFPAPGVLRVNAVRLSHRSIWPEELTQAEMQGREDCWRMFELWKEELGEFKDAYFQASGPAVGVRESRRIRGEYTLTKEDVLAGRRFADVVVKGSWYLDRHPVDAPGYHPPTMVKAYHIPYRTLLPQKIDNLLAAGRCHSATTEALASSRVGVTAMGMGQAAGVAAALAAKGNTSPHAIHVRELQDNLLRQGAILDD